MHKWTDDEIRKEALSWQLTKWKHGVALKGYGADCVQFLVALAKTFGWLPADFQTRTYPADWALHNEASLLEADLAQICTRVDGEPMQMGDVLVYESGKTGGHAGMYIGNGEIIHSHIRRGVEVWRMASMELKLRSVWRLPHE